MHKTTNMTHPRKVEASVPIGPGGWISKKDLRGSMDRM